MRTFMLALLIALPVVLLFLVCGFLFQALDEEEFPNVPSWARPAWLMRLVYRPKPDSPAKKNVDKP